MSSRMSVTVAVYHYGLSGITEEDLSMSRKIKTCLCRGEHDAVLCSQDRLAPEDKRYSPGVLELCLAVVLDSGMDIHPQMMPSVDFSPPSD